jgi:hypothetical protein
MNILFYLNRFWNHYIGASPFYYLARGAMDDSECTVVWTDDFAVMPPEVELCDVLVTDIDPTVSSWFGKLRKGVVKVCLDGDMHRFTRKECDLYASILPRYDIVLNQYRFSSVESDFYFLLPKKDRLRNLVFFPHLVPDEPCQRRPRELGGIRSGMTGLKPYPFRAWVDSLDLPIDTDLVHPGYSDLNKMRVTRESFFDSLAKHKVHATGLALGEHGYTVAKYFEIPYAGCLLIAEEPPIVDRTALGFRSGKNCFLFRQGDPDLKDLYLDVLANWPKYAPIAEAGQQLVMSKHTARHRLAYLKSIVNHFRETGVVPRASEQILLFEAVST